MLVDLPDELYARAIDEREYFFAVVVFIDLVDLGGDFQRDASGARYSNRAVDLARRKSTLIGAHTFSESQKNAPFITMSAPLVAGCWSSWSSFGSRPAVNWCLTGRRKNTQLDWQRSR